MLLTTVLKHGYKPVKGVYAMFPDRVWFKPQHFLRTALVGISGRKSVQQILEIVLRGCAPSPKFYMYCILVRSRIL